MKSLLHLAILALALIACPLRAAEPDTLNLLDGRTLHHAQAKLLDLWTLSITHEDGTTTVPTALLANLDLARVAPRAAIDGRFWLERSDALYRLWKSGDRKVPLPEAMAEAAPHTAEIKAYIEARDAAAAIAAGRAAASQRTAREEHLRKWEVVSDPWKFREWTEAVARERYLSRK